MLGRLVRAVTAMAALLSILVGVPVVLWLAGRELGAGYWSAWAAAAGSARWGGLSVLGNLLSRPDDGGLLLTVLLGIALLAWLIVTYSILAEAIAVALRRPVPRIDLPGFRASRAVAAVLVGAVLSAGSTSAWAAPPAAATILSAPNGLAPVTLSGAAEQPGTGLRSEPREGAPGIGNLQGRSGEFREHGEFPEYTVQRHDTLWGIAEHKLCDGFRWPEIAALNPQVTDAQLLRPGWVLRLPDDAVCGGPIYTVRDSDTLSGIAAAELGDPGHAGSLFDRNRGVMQPDSDMLVSPDLLQPGWKLVLPAIGVNAADRASEPHVPPRAAPQPRPTPQPIPTPARPAEPGAPQVRPAPPASTTATAPASPPPAAPAPAAPAPGAPTPEPSAASTSSPTIGPPSAESTDPAAGPGMGSGTGEVTPPRQGEGEGADVGAVLAPVGAAAGLLLIGLISMLVVRRRRQQRFRQPRHRIPAPRGRSARTEWATMRGDSSGSFHANPPGASSGDASAWPPAVEQGLGGIVSWTFLDTALRGLVLADWTGVDEPAVQMVVLEPGRAVLVIPALLPGPFTPLIDEPGGHAWELDAAAVLPLSPEDALGYCAPFPTLVSVASTSSSSSGSHSSDSGEDTGDDVTDSGLDEYDGNGTGDGGEAVLLLDLEEIGVAHLTGPPEAVVALLRHIAAELATAPWSEDVEVLLAGDFGDEMLALNPERLHGVDLATGLATVTARARSAATTLEELDVETVLHARLRPLAPDSWLPVVLLATGPATDADRAALAELATMLGSERRRPAVVVTTGMSTAGQEIHIGESGELITLGVGEGWVASGMTAQAAADLAGVLGPTWQPAVPVGPAQDEQPWAEDMAEDGGLSLMFPAWDPDTQEPPAALHGSPETGWSGGADIVDGTDLGSAGPLGQAGLGEAEPVTGPDLDDAGLVQSTRQPDAPRRTGTGSDTRGSDGGDDHSGVVVGSSARAGSVGAVTRLAAVEQQDPDLDRDLRRWLAPAGEEEVPLIGVLGMPQVRAPGPTPSARVSRLTEILVYLALRPRGVSPVQAQTDLWEDAKSVRDTTIRAAVYGARRWAGRGLGGDIEAPFVSELTRDGIYLLRGHLLDWDLFRRLRKRGQARHAAGHSDAAADYVAALGLVRGPVLSPLPKRGYAWLGDHPARVELHAPGWIVDTAHELVDLAVAAGEMAEARQAAETARLVDPDLTDDRPLLDLMRIAHAEGQLAEMERYADMLIEARDPDDLWESWPEDTFAVLNDLVPHKLRTRR